MFCLSQMVAILLEFFPKISIWICWTIYKSNLKGGYSGVFLPDHLEIKYKNALKELVWQWFFPAKKLTFIPKAKKYRRYHLYETHVQKAIRNAVRKSKITKWASAHAFWHSCASHFLEANYDIHTTQELLGHSDVRTNLYPYDLKSKESLGFIINFNNW